jgi:hypothetical protein
MVLLIITMFQDNLLPYIKGRIIDLFPLYPVDRGRSFSRTLVMILQTTQNHIAETIIISLFASMQ